MSKCIGTLFTLLLSFSMAYAQPFLTGRNCALAGSDPLGMFGVRAVGANPALLASPVKPARTIILPSFGLSFGNNTFSPRYLGNTFVEDDTLSESDIEAILSKVNSETLDLFGRISLPVIGFSSENYALNVLDFHLLASASIPESIFELAMRGWENDSTYIFDDVEEELLFYWSSSVTVGTPLPKPNYLSYLSVGLTLKYLTGENYIGLGEHHGYWLVTADRIETNGLFQLMEATGGDGIGLDIGAIWGFNRGKTNMGITIGNLVGSIKWNDVEVTEISFERNVGIEIDSVARDDYLSNFFHDKDTTFYLNDFTTDLPKYMLLSIQREGVLGLKNMDGYFSWYQGFNDVTGNSTVPRIAMGGEYNRLKYLPVRLGIAFGGLEAFEIAGGLGVEFVSYRFDIGASWQRGLFNSAKGFKVSLTNHFDLTK